MINVERIEDWIGLEALDTSGERLGKIDEMYYSHSALDEPVFVAIKSGLLGRHRRLVPLQGASVGREYVRLSYTAEQVEQAASGFDADDVLEEDAVRSLGTSYGLDIPPGGFESASSIEQRRNEAAEAAQRADQLEREAQERAAEAEQAKGAAEEAGDQAKAKAREAEQARSDAKQARSDAKDLSG